MAGWAIGLASRNPPNGGFREFLAVQIVRGLGSMIAMVAAQMMTISTLPVTMMKDASGLINLIRNVAGAIGLAAIAPILSRQTAAHYTRIPSAGSTASPPGRGMVGGLSGM